jgi:hypothetical protein
VDSSTETTSKVIYNEGSLRSIDKIVLTYTDSNCDAGGSDCQFCIDSIIAIDAHFLNPKFTTLKLREVPSGGDGTMVDV